MIKHISFDFWNTLYKSNPKHRIHRANIVKKFFQLTDSVEYISNKISEVGKEFDNFGSIYETFNSSEQISYFCLLSLLKRRPTKKETDIFKNISDESSIDYPPILINKHKIIEIFKYCKEKDVTISLLSNTGLQNGRILFEIMKNDSIIEYFDYFIFSDECQSFKPHKKMFELTYNHPSCNAYEDRLLGLNSVLHVGDSLMCDIEGAKNYGFDAFLFTPEKPNYDELFLKIKNSIKK